MVKYFLHWTNNDVFLFRKISCTYGTNKKKYGRNKGYFKIIQQKKAPSKFLCIVTVIKLNVIKEREHSPATIAQ